MLLEQQEATGKLQVMLNSKVSAIHAKYVEIEIDGTTHQHTNDAVIVCAGGLLPTPLLQKIGVQFETKYGHE